MATNAPQGQETGWQDVIDVLIEEHANLLSLLDALSEKSAQLRRGKIPDYPLLLDMVDYMLHYPDEYHHPREDLIYKLLLREDPSFSKLNDRLQREHQVLHRHSTDLFKMLVNICKGKPADRNALKR